MRSTASDAPALVVLRGGVVAPVDALRLLWRLEDLGCTVRLDGDGLLVGPRTKLTDHDRAAIVQHRAELIAIVRYCEESVQ